MHTLAEGGIAVGISKMAFGNKVGVDLTLAEEALFAEGYFNFILEVKAGATLPAELNAEKIGQTTAAESITVAGETLAIDTLIAAWTGTLESTYPSNSEVAHRELETFTYDGAIASKSAKYLQKPIACTLDLGKSEDSEKSKK